MQIRSEWTHRHVQKEMKLISDKIIERFDKFKSRINHINNGLEMTINVSPFHLFIGSWWSWTGTMINGWCASATHGEMKIHEFEQKFHWIQYIWYVNVARERERGNLSSNDERKEIHSHRRRKRNSTHN